MDKISKTIDFDDWYTTQPLINILEQRWEKISINRFASDINRNSKRFYSRYLCHETEGISSFSFDWSNEAKSPCATNIPHTKSYQTFSKITHKI